MTPHNMIFLKIGLLCCSLLILVQPAHAQVLVTSNVSNDHLKFSELSTSTTHELYGYFINATIEYTLCIFDTYATAFIVDNAVTADGQLVQNTTIIYRKCVFRTTNAVGIERVVFKGLRIQFIKCELRGYGAPGLPTILLNITGIQGSGRYLDDEINNTGLYVEMNDTDVIEGDAPIIWVQQGGTMSLKNVSFEARGVTLQTGWEIVNGDASGVSLVLSNVHMESARIIAVGAHGFSDIHIYAENSTFLETYETILKIRAGDRQSYRFHNCNFSLLNGRFGDPSLVDANVFFNIEPIDDSGCEALETAYLRCSDWQFASSTCTYRGIPSYPCTGYSALTCGGIDCVASSAFNTTVGAMVLLYDGRYAAPSANTAILNVSAWIGCTLQRMRLVVSEEDAAQVGGDGAAHVVIATCNASLCPFDALQSGACLGCTSLVVNRSNVYGDGTWHDVGHDAHVVNASMTLMVRSAAGMGAYAGAAGTPVMELEVTCPGACVAPCASRDDVNITLSGEIYFFIEGGLNAFGSLVTMQNSNNVRLTIGDPSDSAAGTATTGTTVVVGLPPIQVGDGARGAQTVYCVHAVISMSSAFLFALPSVSPTNLDIRFTGCDVHQHATAANLIGFIVWRKRADFASLQLSLQSSTVAVSLQRPEDATGGLEFSLLFVTGAAVLTWNATMSLTVNDSSVVVRLANGKLSAKAAALVWVFNTSASAQPMPPNLFRYDAASRGMQVAITIANSYVSCRSTPVVLWTDASQSSSCYLRHGSVVSIANTTFALSPLDGEPLRVLLWGTVQASQYLAQPVVRAAAAPYLALRVDNITVTTFNVCPSGNASDVVRVRLYLMHLVDSSLRAFHAEVDNVLVHIPNDCTIVVQAPEQKNIWAFYLHDTTAINAVVRTSRVFQFASMHWMLQLQPPPAAFGNVFVSMVYLSPLSRILQSNIAASNQPFVVVPLPGKVRIAHWVVWAEGVNNNATPPLSWSLQDTNISATCVANAMVNASSSKDVRIEFNNLRTTYEQLLWIRHPSNVLFSVVSCDLRPTNVRGDVDFVWTSNASEIRLIHGCNAPNDDSFFVDAFAGPQETTTSCDGFDAADAKCAKIASTSSSRTDTASFSPTMTRAERSASSSMTVVPSISHTSTASPSDSQSHDASASPSYFLTASISFPSVSQAVSDTETPTKSPTNTTLRATASPSTTLTPRLAYIVAEVFSHISSDCPDMTATDDLSSIQVPVEWVQRTPVSVTFNVTRAAAQAFFQNGGTALSFAPTDVVADVRPSVVLDAVGRTVRLTFGGPIDYNPFELKAFDLVVGPDPHLVHPLVGTVAVAVKLTPLDTTMPPVVTDAISTTTSTVSLLTLNPVSSGTQSRVNMLLSLKVCSYAAENDDYSFLGLGLGSRDADAFFYRGAIVGNIALVVGIAIVVLLGIGGASLASSRGFTTAASNLLTALHMPGLLMPPVALLLQPTASASVALFLIGDGTAADVVLALFGVVSCTSVVGYASIALITNRSLLTVQKRSEVRHSPTSRWGALDATWHASSARRWIVSDFHWVPAGSRVEVGNQWKKRHLQLFADYSLMQFAAFALLCDFAIAVVNGLAASGIREVCTFQLVLMVVLYAVQTAILTLLTPVLSLVTLSALCMTNGCSMCCALLVLVAVASPNQAVTTVCLDASNFVATIVSLLATLQTLPMFVEGLFSLPSILRQVQWAKEGGSELGHAHRPEVKEEPVITLHTLTPTEGATDEGVLDGGASSDDEAPSFRDFEVPHAEEDTEEAARQDIPREKNAPPQEHIFSSQMASNVSSMLRETNEKNSILTHSSPHRSFLDEFSVVEEDLLQIEL